ncbi:MAG TPA: cytochrome c [Terracidiphilus sp.]|jgi:mono/diheme cytochrome c family protein
MIRRTFALICLLVSASLLLGAAASSRWDRVPAKDHTRSNPLATRPENVSAGALVYKEHCAQCHRSDGLGDGHKKPPLRSNHIKSASDGDLEWFLRQGDLGHGMPSWSSLPEAQRWQLIAYLRSIQ